MNLTSVMVNQRFWEIDTLRGISISMMIIYHIIFDAVFLNILQINLHSIPLRIFLYPIGTIFLFLVGLCLPISYHYAQDTVPQKKLFKKIFVRGLSIFGIGLIITAITYFLIGRGFIIFGVLHCIGLSIILAYPFLTKLYPSIIAGFSIILIGIMLRMVTWDFPWLLWLGFVPNDFYTLDYFPLFPWFGVILIGVACSNRFYTNGKRQFSLPDWSRFPFFRFLSILGRHSLFIYVMHQPIILGLFFLFFDIN
ncbi:MAG: heparan-alpha-glucosaminide N-acetyltransferase [Thermoplasmatota archaeon]